MPLWLLILGGVAIYLWAKGQSGGAASPQLPTASPFPQTQPSPSTIAVGSSSPAGDFQGSSWADDIPTPQSSVPPPMQPGQNVAVPDGTALFSDSKLTQSAGKTTGMQTVTVMQTSVGADGSISGSYTDASGKVYWFAQPGT